jgi:hypothetical protein
MEKYIIILSNADNLRTDNSYKNLVDRIQSHQLTKVYHALPPHVLIFDFAGNSAEFHNELKSCIDQTDHALFLQVDPSFTEKGAGVEKMKLLNDFFGTGVEVGGCVGMVAEGHPTTRGTGTSAE